MDNISDVPPEVRRSVEEVLSTQEGWVGLSEEERQERIDAYLCFLQESRAESRKDREWTERTAAGRRTVLGSVSSPPPWGERCREHAGPPCWPLLDDSFTVLTDRERWPKHVCYAVTHESLRRWAWENLKTLSAEQRVAFTIYTPLPVGKVSLMHRAAQYDEAMITACARIYPYMPFSGDEFAALILRPDIPGVDATFFGTLEPSQAGFHAGDALFETHGQLDQPGLSRFIQSSREWWSGKPRIGRPKGTTTIASIEDVYAADTRFFHAYGKWPSLKQLAYHLGVSDDTLRRNLRVWGTSWQEFKGKREQG